MPLNAPSSRWPVRALDFVVDENVQIHGGMGYSEEALASRAYRDARINRIFEGTNEINRLLMVDMLLQGDERHPGHHRARLGGTKELAGMPGRNPRREYAQEIKAIQDFKKIILMVAGGAAKMQMDGPAEHEREQELLMNVSDMMIDSPSG